LKQHHIDLADLIHDVNVHAKGTHDNLDRVMSKLFLRKKYEKKLTPRHDVKIWQYETKTLIADLKYSSEKLDPIIKAIDKLQKDCVRSSDNLDNVILAIKTDIK
jgi:DNA repair ATPase RecN